MRRLVFVSLCLAALLPTFSSSAAPLGSRELDAVPLHVLAPDDVERLRSSLPPVTGKAPVRLSVNVAMPLGLDGGAWSEDGAMAVWRMRVYSGGATLLIAALDRFDLPDGGELRFSDVAGTVVRGPYTRTDRAPEGGLWTAMVPGEQALFEIRVPATHRDAVDFHLARLGHGIIGLHAAGIPSKSGSCNRDAACAEGDNWRDQIRSVVHLQIPEGTLYSSATNICTGQLINNTGGDTTRPFLLTANHCGATAVTAPGVVAYFNFQTAICSGLPSENEDAYPSQTGATFRVSHSRSDHTLLELNALPSAALNVFYTGFNADTDYTPGSGASIHHPAGHEKRISLFNNARRVNGKLVGDFVADTFEVRWTSGVTEGGSSGAGLWNPAGLLVGVLSGGRSSCSIPDGEDYYGRLDVAWDHGISAFLDTAGTGSRSVGGRNADGAPVGGGGSDPGDVGGDDGADSGNDGGGGGAFGGALLLLAVALARRIRFSARS